jgi:hypothetical protein
LTGLTAAETEVKAVGGVALSRIGDADTVIARPVGRGWAIYLNTLIDHYPIQRAKNFGGTAHRALVNILLEHAGVRPGIEIQSPDGKRLTRALVARFRFGDAEVLAVVKDNIAAEAVAGQDGVTIYNDAGIGRIAKQEVTIKLPRNYHVTEIRTAKRLGLTGVIRTSLATGDAVLFGLNHTEDAISLRGPDSAGLGEKLEFTITSSRPGRRLVRCHIFAPDGSFIPAYAKNLLMENTSESVVIPSALNDPAGVYTLRVTDVVNGATAEARVRLK